MMPVTSGPTERVCAADRTCTGNDSATNEDADQVQVKVQTTMVTADSDTDEGAEERATDEGENSGWYMREQMISRISRGSLGIALTRANQSPL